MAAPYYDPSQIHLAMPVPPPPPPPVPTRSKSRLLDVLKILVGLIIALTLIAILIVLIVAPRTTSNTTDLSESNEKIAKLQRESNENIARLQRISNENISRVEVEQQRLMENERQIRQELFIEKQRAEDQLLEEHRREQDLQIEFQRQLREQNITQEQRLIDQTNERINRELSSALSREQLKQELELEEKRLRILSEEKQLIEQHRKEDLSKVNGDLLDSFIDEVMSSKEPLNTNAFLRKLNSLLRRFDPLHKSLLIDFLYQNELLNNIDLGGANLKELNLNDKNIGSEQGIRLNYTQLSLPRTILINASFDQIDMNKSNFTRCIMMGVSFRRSQVTESNFSAADLSLSDFTYADVTQSDFSYTKIERATFQNVILSYAQMNHAKLRSTNFQQCVAINTNFSMSDLSYADFQYADLSQAQMHQSTIGSANFYSAKANQADFSRAYMSDSIFRWADLKDASFRYAFLTGANFENADVQNVDFTGAMLAGVHITSGQLDTVLSIAHATLPDGSQGKNKNLIKNGNAQCTEMNDTINDWINSGNVFLNRNELNTECAFQTREINATLQQRIDMRRYERIIKLGQSNIYIEMQEKAAGDLNTSVPPVYMNLRFYDSENNQIGSEESTLSSSWFQSPSTFVATLPCPSTTVELQATVVFREANATVDNIYVTIQ